MKRVLVVVSIVVLIGLIGFGTYTLLARNTQEQAPVAEVATEELKPENTFESIEGRYLFHGTIAWDRAIERDANGDYSRPFSLLSTFEREKYDSWIADLECPVTNNYVPYQTQVDSLIFNCPPAFNKEAKKYFDILNLANNHSYDQGREGFGETQEHLTKDGFQVYGSYDLADKQNHCEVMSLPVRLKKADTKDTEATIPVAFCAYHAVFDHPTEEQLATVAEYSKVMPVFAFAHQGVEYTPSANDFQRNLSRDLIDLGAEFVIMNHPHWVQDTDVYKDKLIVYSTGNFIYDQLDYDTQRSASYDIKMTANYDENLQAWIDYTETCDATKLHDSCLENLPNNLQKPTFSYLYDVVAGDERPPQRWLARKAGAELQADTEQRTNWAETLQKLGQTERLN